MCMKLRAHTDGQADRETNRNNKQFEWTMLDCNKYTLSEKKKICKIPLYVLSMNNMDSMFQT